MLRLVKRLARWMTPTWSIGGLDDARRFGFTVISDQHRCVPCVEWKNGLENVDRRLPGQTESFG